MCADLVISGARAVRLCGGAGAASPISVCFGHRSCPLQLHRRRPSHEQGAFSHIHLHFNFTCEIDSFIDLHHYSFCRYTAGGNGNFTPEWWRRRRPEVINYSINL